MPMKPPLWSRPLTRRELLRYTARGVSAYPAFNLACALMSCSGPGSSSKQVPSPVSDDEFLDQIERASFQFFWEQASPTTGQVKDRALAAGNDRRTVSSS